MRIILFICVLFLIPPAILLYGDYTRTSMTGSFHLSSVADVWIEYDRPGFEAFKSPYVGRPDQWDRDIRPYLEWKALPFAFLPAILFYFLVFLAFITGWGPFRNIDEILGIQDKADFARSSANKQSKRQKFSRK